MIEIMIALVSLWFIVVASLWGYFQEKKEWNNGSCKCEKGFWKSFDVDSSGAVGYTCTSCHKCIWISYKKITKGNKNEGN